MTEQEIQETVQVYLRKKHLTKQEMEWLLQHQPQMLEVVQQKFVVATDHMREPISDKAQQNWLKLQGLIEKTATPMRWWRYAVAAAAIIFVAATGYFAMDANRIEKIVFKRNFDRQPGGNVATIQLADGRVLRLDSVGVGELAQEGNTSIAINNTGEVEYQLKPGGISNELQYNTMKTPMGGQYRLKLNDGTVVWLNAGSSITYPVAFGPQDRRVKAKGELYFEIAQQKNRPFIVEVDNMAVKVLGTAFNVCNYDNENEVSTTLLEGAVRVSNLLTEEGAAPSDLKNNHHAQNDVPDTKGIILVPGQQALINKKEPEQLKINEVNDLQQIVAWKNGLFNFNGSDLKTVMRQLERWYNIEVRYTREMENVKFTGKLYRNTNLADVLNVLELMDVQFKMEGNILYVK